jgi:hypothetical protein
MQGSLTRVAMLVIIVALLLPIVLGGIAAREGQMLSMRRAMWEEHQRCVAAQNARRANQ